MNAFRFTTHRLIGRIGRAARSLAALALTILLTGCEHDGSSASKGGGDGGGDGSSGVRIDAANAEARSALMAKVEEHWLKTDKGWISEFIEQLPLNPPRRVFLQYQNLGFGFEVKVLTDSDRLNNIEWMGWSDFKRTPHRTWHETGNGEMPMGWSLWRDEAPTYRVTVYKRAGKWIVNGDELLGMFEGRKPVDVPEG